MKTNLEKAKALKAQFDKDIEIAEKNFYKLVTDKIKKDETLRKSKQESQKKNDKTNS